ncbi:mechanosensitive ion channel [Pseudodesulfovibrio sp. F-1]|uniref:Mechanosensitive ion channel n=1 Tax=Pseudodesulfovibrio alkaliphilus TaxID=2661613 RepID=A0A7K1KMK2_9BACT|nr:mechanosensitive ion channel domain-containing protein [Pseudodesulfovibrio alkaliphilus]MUM77313.1 mechanosensitive ion channel [Pseudodesulfovibrio alkaliphilus]
MDALILQILDNPQLVKVAHTVALALTLLVLARMARSFATRRGRPVAETPHAIKYATMIAFVVGLVFIWFEGLSPVFAALTFVAAALTIVSKEFILNFLGSFVIFWRELFAIGDRVQVGENAGDVIAKGVLYFTLLESGGCGTTGHSTGKLVKVPNAHVLTLPVVNHTRGAGYLWHELRLTLTPASDWQRARSILLDAAEAYRESQSMDLDKIRAAFERRSVYFREMTPRVYVTVAPGGIRLTLRHLCRTRLIRESEDFIITRVLGHLAPGELELAAMQTE